MFGGFASCSLDESTRKDRCFDDRDCLSGRVCDEGVCRKKPPGSGRGGTSGNSGTDSGGGTCGQSCAGWGGHGGEPESGGTGATAPTGGAAGSGPGGGGADGGGGAGGSGGFGLPDFGKPCRTEGTKACSTSRRDVVLRCAEGTWETDMVCSPTRLCNASAECQAVAPECIGQPLGKCLDDRDGLLVDCSSDPFTPTDRHCPYGCVDGACLPGSGDQLIVHTELQGSQEMQWSDAIPVCFASDPGEALERITRSTVEQGWARYLDVDFTGFGTCTDEDTTGVIMEFPRGCRGRLASPVTRDRSAAPVRVGVCASYFDAAGTTEHELVDNEALARFVIRHQFGHVLGLGEMQTSADAVVMKRTVRASDVDSTVWSHDIWLLEEDYGYKPEGAIVHVSGRCLTAQGDTVGLAPCAGIASQVFRSFPDRIEGDGGRCLVVNGYPSKPSVALADCSLSPPANVLAQRQSQWRAPGHCVVPRDTPAAAGGVLETRTCVEPFDAAATFSFEITGNDGPLALARIRYGSADLCVSAPPTLTAALNIHAATLEPCDTGASVFTLGPGGQISLLVPGTETRRCLEWYSSHSVVHFRECRNLPFVLSGPLETPGGLALASAEDEPLADLTVVALGPGDAPELGEIFDVHF
ncbi:MAG TPA: hypothetical protein VFZ53_19225 [Polyangiaceae bacterium]